MVVHAGNKLTSARDVRLSRVEFLALDKLARSLKTLLAGMCRVCRARIAQLAD